VCSQCVHNNERYDLDIEQGRGPVPTGQPATGRQWPPEGNCSPEENRIELSRPCVANNRPTLCQVGVPPPPPPTVPGPNSHVWGRHGRREVGPSKPNFLLCPNSHTYSLRRCQATPDVPPMLMLPYAPPITPMRARALRVAAAAAAATPCCRCMRRCCTASLPALRCCRLPKMPAARVAAYAAAADTSMLHASSKHSGIVTPQCPSRRDKKGDHDQRSARGGERTNKMRGKNKRPPWQKATPGYSAVPRPQSQGRRQ